MVVALAFSRLKTVVKLKNNKYLFTLFRTINLIMKTRHLVLPILLLGLIGCNKQPAQTSEPQATTTTTQSNQSTSSQTAGQQTATPAHGSDIQNEDFPLSAKSWSASLIELEGENTAQASAIGKVTRLNASEYCTRDPDGETDGSQSSINQCIERLLGQQQDKLYSITANCIDKTITTSHQGSFHFTGVFENSEGFPISPWQHDTTAELAEGVDGDLPDVQFAVVCPSFKTW
jgi:hypothetical protein